MATATASIVRVRRARGRAGRPAPTSITGLLLTAIDGRIIQAPSATRNGYGARRRSTCLSKPRRRLPARASTAMHGVHRAPLAGPPRRGQSLGEALPSPKYSAGFGDGSRPDCMNAPSNLGFEAQARRTFESIAESDFAFAAGQQAHRDPGLPVAESAQRAAQQSAGRAALRASPALRDLAVVVPTPTLCCGPRRAISACCRRRWATVLLPAALVDSALAIG